MASGLKIEPGSLFGADFRVIRPLNQGGMGAVYLVEQISTGTCRALKVMHEHLLKEDKLRRRFEQEARVCGRIRSDHVVQVISAGIAEAAGVPWIVMELLEGCDLGAYVASRGRLPVAQVNEVCRQLCHALVAAHNEGIVHRDLKPENLFLSEARREGSSFTLKVLDFGIAKILSQAAPTSTTAAIGTPLWMAPEQTDAGAAIVPATDVWSLGLIVFWLLTGRPYWKSASREQSSAMALLREIVLEPIVSPSHRAAELGCHLVLPVGFDPWFARCVARDPSARFQNAAQARDTLLALLGAATTHLQPESGIAYPGASIGDPSDTAPLMLAPTEVATPAVGDPRAAAEGSSSLATVPGVSETYAPESKRVRSATKKWAALTILFLIGLSAVVGAVSVRGRRTATASLHAECDRGSPKACITLAKGYEAGGMGLTRNMSQSAVLWDRACNLGDSASCLYLGNLYQSGERLLHDDARAAAAFEKACDRGEGLACRAIAWMHLAGDGVPKSEARAVWFLVKSCELGQAEGCTKAGEMYREGRGVPKDPDRGKELVARGCFGRDERACKQMDR